jgi:hypothetical protein
VSKVRISRPMTIRAQGTAVSNGRLTEFMASLGEVLAEPPVGTIYEVSSTKTLDEAFAEAGIGG